MMQLVSGNQVTLLKNGAEFFPALEQAIDCAETEIHLQTYIFATDIIGQRISAACVRAAQRGVRVHLLLDGFGCKDLPSAFVEQLTQHGVEVLIYGPKISPWSLQRNRLQRMHRKLAVIDGKVGFLGGINIIDDNNTPGHTPPRVDYAVHIQGPLLQNIYKSAQALWRYVNWVSFKRKFKPARLSFLSEAVGEMHAAYVVRDNIWHRRDIEDAYLEAINSAKKEIIIVNAYFLPGLRFRRALYQAVKRGVRVVLLLQERVEYVLLDYASRALYGAFLQHGIQIYEYHKSFMHSKVAVVDDRWATVGSSNIDPLSLLLAREANIVVIDREFAATLKQDIWLSIETGARQLSPQVWSQHIIKRFVAWLVYGLVRIMMGLAGYARHH